MSSSFSRHGNRLPARDQCRAVMNLFRGGCLAEEDLRELAEVIAEDPASLLDYLGPAPRRNADGHIVVVFGKEPGSDIVLTPTALAYGDGRVSVPLPEAARQTVAALVAALRD